MLRQIEIIFVVLLVGFIIAMIRKAYKAYAKDNPLPRVVSQEEKSIDYYIEQIKLKIDLTKLEAEQNIEGAELSLENYKRSLAMAEKRKEEFKNIN